MQKVNAPNHDRIKKVLKMAMAARDGLCTCFYLPLRKTQMADVAMVDVGIMSGPGIGAHFDARLVHSTPSNDGRCVTSASTSPASSGRRGIKSHLYFPYI